MSSISDFLAWLRAREGAAYVWGAQGQEALSCGALALDGKTVSSSWEKWVDGRETSSANAARAKAFIHRKLDEGAARVPLFDCSGLVMRYLQSVAGYLPSDMSAAGLNGMCEARAREEVFPGCLLFRHDGKKAHHVGVYLGDGQAIEAYGRDAGVVIRGVDASGKDYWNRFGALPCLFEPERSVQVRFALCSGGSVNVREGPGTEHLIVCVAHKGDLMIAMHSEVPAWEQVALDSGEGLVTGYMYAKYIDTIEEA